MLTTLLIGFALVVPIAWWLYVRELRDAVQGRRPIVTDEVLRGILEEGRVEGGGPDPRQDEPLDEEEIREAEDWFWEESEWDEPEEYSS